VGGDLSAALLSLGDDQLALVDSLGTWVAAHLESEGPLWQERMATLVKTVRRTPYPVVLVSEETGWGVVPTTAVGGRFRDRLGELQQHLSPHCDAAWLVLQGRALDLAKLAQSVPATP
jgi:adenosylcobinamide kinase/adenosylcobinamide-phosphate guanylyltransferase